MSIEQLIAANTEALNNLAAAIREKFAAGASAAASASTATSSKTTSDKAADTAGETAEPIYWHNPTTKEFGTAESEAEFKKLKKADAKVVKIPASKYEKLVEEASKTSDDDATDGDYSDRILDLISEVPEEPTEDDIRELFTRYLPNDLDKSERDARAELIKPILAGVKAPKATAVKEEDRRDVMIATIKALETHLEETGQAEEGNSLV